MTLVRLLLYAGCAAVLLLTTLSIRLLVVLRRTHSTPRRSPRPATDEALLAVFLGSGGHTAEMMRLVAHLDFARRFTTRVWIVSSGDAMSEQKALAMEKQIGSGKFRILRIPRARRVHQSYLTSPFTTLHSLAFCLWHITLSPLLFSPRPGRKRVFADLILLNGPGSCVPIAASTFLPRLLALPHSRLVYVESLARTRRLSLSATLVRPLVDRFFVQWESLRDELVKREKAGGGGTRLTTRVECEGWLM
ncbi:hypothetical protein JCM8547_000309 [Rhodosporidiobolus lusitaniae]